MTVPPAFGNASAGAGRRAGTGSEKGSEEDVGADGADPGWQARIRTRAALLPQRLRVALHAGPAGECIGSIEPSLAERMRSAGLPVRPLAAGGWRVEAPLDVSLHRLAEWLRDQRLSGRWRGELLDVRAPSGVVLGRIERSAVRALGLTTLAVHLVGHVREGGVWVQQRALDKATDPGLWDTLVGGLVAAGESIADTLARETDEEAGLPIDALHGLRSSGHLMVRRPVADGYLIERIEVFEGALAPGAVPVNRDGEVDHFECLSPAALRERLQHGAFTAEAALILLRWLEARPRAASGGD